TPAVGSATVGTGVQSWEVNASSQPFTPTAKLRVRSAAAPVARTAVASASAASADERSRHGVIISPFLGIRPLAPIPWHAQECVLPALAGRRRPAEIPLQPSRGWVSTFFE